MPIKFLTLVTFQMVLPFSKAGKARVGKDQVEYGNFELSMRHQVEIPSVAKLAWK